jgi:hypothetical protein
MRDRRNFLATGTTLQEYIEKFAAAVPGRGASDVLAPKLGIPR